MSGIYIQNMEMPTCFSCQLESYCNRWAKHDEEWQKGNRDDDCPLIPVPPHGRCIDADSLEKEVCGGCVHGEYKYANCIDCALANAPTILEAEEGER